MSGTVNARPVRERPILFSAPMVKAILAGTKTQTRRVLKKQPPEGMNLASLNGRGEWNCPFGAPGGRLWVRETHQFENAVELIGIDDWRMDCRYIADDATRFIYECDVPIDTPHFRKMATGKKRVSIHMPRWASRITLEIVSVRAERVQDISEEDAKAEGVDVGIPPASAIIREPAKRAFRLLWESINGKGSWAANSWVWRIEFRRLANGLSDGKGER